MEDVLIRQDRVTRDTIEESLKHALSPCNHGRILLRLGLLDRIVADGLLGGYRGYDERRVELDQVVAERLELRVPMLRFGRLHCLQCVRSVATHGHAYPSPNDVCDVRRSRVHGRLQRVHNLRKMTPM